MKEDLLLKLKGAVKGEVDTKPETLTAYSRDASVCEMMPQVVVFPKDASDIKSIVNFVLSEKQMNPNLSITMRGAGTDMSGAAIGDSIIVDTTKHMSGILSWDGRLVRVLPGTFFRDLEREALLKGLFLPSFPASRLLCTVGGIVSNNSAGEKTLVYGQTIKYVRELKVVLSDGNEYTIVPLSRMELEQKIALEGFEGEFYRHLHYLISKNSDTIRRNKPQTRKNASGYYLWDVWDGEKFDLVKLFVGSQGTLGIITEIVFELFPKPKETKMVSVFLKDLGVVAKLVEEALLLSPESIESYDKDTVALAVKYFPDLIKKKPFFEKIKFFFKFMPEFFCFFFYGFPKMVVLIEFGADKKIDLDAKVFELHKKLKMRGFHVHTVSSKGEADKYWTIRRESYNLLRNHSKGKKTAPFIEDVVVPVDKLYEFLPRLHDILHSYDLVYSIAGHAGSGNFHVFPLMDFTNPKHADRIIEISEKVYNLVANYGGSITAEHNDGLARTPFMYKIFSKDMLSLFAETKHIFDPLNIFNPMKKVGATVDYFKSKIRRS